MQLQEEKNKRVRVIIGNGLNKLKIPLDLMVEGCYTYIVINESQLCNSSINQFLSNKYSVSPHWLRMNISFKKKYIQNYQSNLSLVRLFPCEGCTPFHGESQGVGGVSRFFCDLLFRVGIFATFLHQDFPSTRFYKF